MESISQKRESKYIRFARLAYAVAQASVARYAHPKSSQRFTQPQIVVYLLLTQYLNLSYRNTEEWLLASAEVREVLELREVPDHTTIARMLTRLTLPRLEAMLAQVLTQFEGKEDVVTIDATGFRFTQASAYYTTHSGRKHRDWVKEVYAVGVRSQMILAWAAPIMSSMTPVFLLLSSSELPAMASEKTSNGIGCCWQMRVLTPLN